VLERRSEAVERLYFLNGGLSSVSMDTGDGRQIEVASVGNEGLIGVAAAYGDTAPAMASATMLIDGDALWMGIDAFRDAITRYDSTASVINRYLRTFTADLMSAVACQALHPLDQRLARWLLQAQDRIGGAIVPVTHDTLATILSVRRASIALAATALHRRGVLSNSQRRIRVSDRHALEAAACDCYVSMQTSMSRLLFASPTAGRPW